jgi:hypothetical protein
MLSSIVAIISFVLGILALAADFKSYKKKKWPKILAFFLLFLVCGITIYDQQEKDKKEDTFRTSTETHFKNIEKDLEAFGATNKQAKFIAETSNLIQQSQYAEQALQLALKNNQIENPESVTVEYWSKPSDPDINSIVIEQKLKEIGFKDFKIKLSGKKNIPTNSILFDPKLDIKDAKNVAYIFIRAGVQIKAIRPFRQPLGKPEYNSLIQVSGDGKLESCPPLTVEQIRQASLDEINKAADYSRSDDKKNLCPTLAKTNTNSP